MTPEQEGAYIRLLSYAWLQDDCGLPDDDNVLSQLSRLGEGWFNGGSTVVRECFIKKGNRLYNKRLLSERKKQAEWREKSKQGGIKSGKSRRDKKIDNEPNAKGGSLLVEPNAKGGSLLVEPNANIISSSSSLSSNINTDTPISPSEPSDTLPGIEPVPESKPKERPLTPERIMRAWNRMADDTECSRIRELSTSRRKTLNARLKEPFFRENWLHVLHLIAESSFLQGKNDINWKCDFDWYINETNFVKIAEGKYNQTPDEPDTCQLTHEEIQAALAMAEKQRAAAVAAGLCDENGELIIPDTKS